MHGTFRRAAVAGAALAALAALAAPAVVRAAGEPRRDRPSLTNEGIVRMVMAGASDQEILGRIAAEPVDFDLTPEVLAELRQAGVREPILEAMRRRQAEMKPPETAPLPPPVASGTLQLDFVPDPAAKGEAEQSAIAVTALPRGMPRHGGVEVGEVTDLSLAILCTTTDHVPDHWDARTPLKADAPRHELLLFRAGSGQATLKGFKVLYLRHDPSYQVALAAGTHDIQVAVAGLQAGSRSWRMLAIDGARVTIREDHTTRLAFRARSHVRGSAMTGFNLDSEWKVASVEAAQDAP